MCYATDKDAEIPHLARPDPTLSYDLDKLVRQFRDIGDLAQGSDYDAFNAALDFSPLEERTTKLSELSPVKGVVPPAPANNQTGFGLSGLSGRHGTGLGMGQMMAGRINQPRVLSEEEFTGANSPYYVHPRAFRSPGPLQGGKPPTRPVYERPQADPISAPQSVYEQFSSMPDSDLTTMTTQFAQRLREAEGNEEAINAILDEYGIRDVVGHSQRLRGAPSAKVGANQGTVPKAANAPANATGAAVNPAGAQGQDIASAIVGDTLFNTSIKSNNRSVRNVT